MDDDALADLDAAGEDLVRLYDRLDIPAVLMTFRDGQLVVLCIGQHHVPVMCKRVLEQYESPEGKTLN